MWDGRVIIRVMLGWLVVMAAVVVVVMLLVVLMSVVLVLMMVLMMAMVIVISTCRAKHEADMTTSLNLFVIFPIMKVCFDFLRLIDLSILRAQIKPSKKFD